MIPVLVPPRQKVPIPFCNTDFKNHFLIPWSCLFICSLLCVGFYFVPVWTLLFVFRMQLAGVYCGHSSFNYCQTRQWRPEILRDAGTFHSCSIHVSHKITVALNLDEHYSQFISKHSRNTKEILCYSGTKIFQKFFFRLKNV